MTNDYIADLQEYMSIVSYRTNNWFRNRFWNFLKTVVYKVILMIIAFLIALLLHSIIMDIIYSPDDVIEEPPIIKHFAGYYDKNW